jgi:hypothetical protein
VVRWAMLGFLSCFPFYFGNFLLILFLTPPNTNLLHHYRINTRSKALGMFSKSLLLVGVGIGRIDAVKTAVTGHRFSDSIT